MRMGEAKAPTEVGVGVGVGWGLTAGGFRNQCARRSRGVGESDSPAPSGGQCLWVYPFPLRALPLNHTLFLGTAAAA